MINLASPDLNADRSGLQNNGERQLKSRAMSDVGGNKPTIFEQMLNRVSAVKLTGGLIGRVCTVLIVVVIGFVVLGAKSELWWMAPLSLIAIFSFAFPILWLVLRFAKTNPHAAIFDGAELLQYEQLTHSSKNHPTIIVNPGSKTEGHTVPTIPYSEISKPDAPNEHRLLTKHDHAEETQ